MLSKFVDKLKGRGVDEKFAFRSRVVEILSEIYPQYKIKKPENPDLIFIEETQNSLINLHSKFLLSSRTNFDLKELVKEHFSSLQSIIENIDEDKDEIWEDVKERVFLQLMPAEYCEQLSCLAFSFSREIKIGVVIDDENSYSYVLFDQLVKWEIEKEETYQTAFENLEKASDGIALDELGDEWHTKGLICNQEDSFDAARILTPSLQKTVAEVLGESFYFGIPNRDFLVCWSKQTDKEFQDSVKLQIQIDFNERPYPLSENVFELNEGGKIKQISGLEIY